MITTIKTKPVAGLMKQNDCTGSTRKVIMKTRMNALALLVYDKQGSVERLILL